MKKKVFIALSMILFLFSCATTSNFNQNPFVQAAADGDIEKVTFMLSEGADINQKSNYGNTGLYLAIKNKQYDMAKFLIEQGADVTIGDTLGWTTRRQEVELSKILLEKGAVQTTSSGRSCFYYLIKDEELAKEQKVEVIKSILGEAAVHSSILLDVKDAENYDYYVDALAISFEEQIPGTNMTILHIAADRFNADLVKYLLGAGFDVNSKDSQGNTAITYAAMAYGPELNWLDPIQEDASMVKLNFVSDMPYYSNPGAIQQRNIQTVLSMLEADADLNVQNDNGWSVLHFAAYSKPAGLIELLLENGAEKSLKTKFDRTAVEIAKQKGNKSALEVLQ